MFPGLMQRVKNTQKPCFVGFFVFVLFLRHRPETLLKPSHLAKPASLASKHQLLLQYFGINIPLWLNQLFENEFLGTAVIIKDRHAEVNGNLCVSQIERLC